MAVREKGRNKYQVDIKVGGIRIFRKTLECSLVAAQDLEKACIEHYNTHNNLNSFDPLESLKGNDYNAATLGNLLNRKIKLTWGKSTAGSHGIRNAHKCLESLQGDGYKLNVNDLTRSMLNDLVVTFRENNPTLSDATINRYLASLSALVTLADEEDLLEIKRPKFPRFRESEGRMRIYTSKDKRDQLEYLKYFEKDPMFSEIVEIGYETGARLGEILGIDLDLDIKGTNWHIQRTMDNNHTKTFKSRFVPITKRFQEIILESRKRNVYNNRPYLGTTNSQVARVFRRCREHLGHGNDKDYVFHTIRHSVLTALLANGRSLFEVAEWAGHSDFKTTRRYLKMVNLFKTNYEDSLNLEIIE